MFLLGIILGFIVGALTTFVVLAVAGEADRKRSGHYE